MKIKLLVAIILCSFSQILHAQYETQNTAMNYDLYPWSLGMDVKYMYFKPTADFSPILDQNKIGGTIFFAYRPGKTFDYELGFSWTTRDTKNLIVTPGVRVLGATAGNTATHISRVRFEDTYLDIHANLPMSQYLEFKMGVGVGVVRQKFKFTNHPSDSSDPLQHALHILKGKSTVTGRVILGMQALLSKRLGLRLMYNYETYQNIRVRNTEPGVNRKLMSNAYTVLLGAFWIFNGD